MLTSSITHRHLTHIPITKILRFASTHTALSLTAVTHSRSGADCCIRLCSGFKNRLVFTVSRIQNDIGYLHSKRENGMVSIFKFNISTRTNTFRRRVFVFLFRYRRVHGAKQVALSTHLYQHSGQFRLQLSSRISPRS